MAFATLYGDFDAPWRGHPFHYLNNCNGIDGDPPTGSPPARTGNGLRVHSLQLPAITAVQRRYVLEMIATLNHFDNILWEVANESDFDIAPPATEGSLDPATESARRPSSVAWQYAVIDFIKQTEQRVYPKQHLVWMSASRNLPTSFLVASHADVISPGGDAYKRPPIASGSKIQILDTDHIWGLGGDRTWVWKSFTRGYHPIFMDPEFGIPLFSDTIEPKAGERQRLRNALRDASIYARRINLAAMTPRGPEVCSTGYCLVDEGQAYLIYQSLHSLYGDNTFTVKLPDGEYHFEHFNPFDSRLVSRGQLTVRGGSAFFDLPERPVVYLERLPGEPRQAIPNSSRAATRSGVSNPSEKPR